MDKLLEIMNAIGIPFAYDHCAEGESPAPPFICYLLPGSDNFAADGKAYYKINEVNIELYTDTKDLSAEQKVEDVPMVNGYIKAKTGDSTTDAVYQKWYEAVYIPTSVETVPEVQSLSSTAKTVSTNTTTTAKTTTAAKEV